MTCGSRMMPRSTVAASQRAFVTAVTLPEFGRRGYDRPASLDPQSFGAAGFGVSLF